MIRILSFSLLLRLSIPAQTISTFAGAGPPDNLPALSTRLRGASGLVTDTAGRLYFVSERVIYQLGTDGLLRRYAGTGAAGSSATEGVANKVALSRPASLRITASGTLYFIDDSRFLRRVTPEGQLETLLAAESFGPVVSFRSVALLPGGDPVVALLDAQTGKASFVRWNGVDWAALPGSLPLVARVLDMTADSQGNLYYILPDPFGVYGLWRLSASSDYREATRWVDADGANVVVAGGSNELWLAGAYVQRVDLTQRRLETLFDPGIHRGPEDRGIDISGLAARPGGDFILADADGLIWRWDRQKFERLAGTLTQSTDLPAGRLQVRLEAPALLLKATDGALLLHENYRRVLKLNDDLLEAVFYGPGPNLVPLPMSWTSDGEGSIYYVRPASLAGIRRIDLREQREAQAADYRQLLQTPGAGNRANAANAVAWSGGLIYANENLSQISLYVNGRWETLVQLDQRARYARGPLRLDPERRLFWIGASGSIFRWDSGSGEVTEIAAPAGWFLRTFDVDPAGNVYAQGETGPSPSIQAILLLRGNQEPVRLAGSADAADMETGPASDARIYQALDLIWSGNALYFIEGNWARIRKIELTPP